MNLNTNVLQLQYREGSVHVLRSASEKTVITVDLLKPNQDRFEFFFSLPFLFSNFLHLACFSSHFAKQQILPEALNLSHCVNTTKIRVITERQLIYVYLYLNSIKYLFCYLVPTNTPRNRNTIPNLSNCQNNNEIVISVYQ